MFLHKKLRFLKIPWLWSCLELLSLVSPSNVTAEEPVAEVISETHEGIQSLPDSINATKEIQKKSHYASIVEVTAPLASSAPTTANDVPKTAVAKQIRAVAAPVMSADTSALSKDAVENGQNHDEGHSIYVKALYL